MLIPGWRRGEREVLRGREKGLEHRENLFKED
jgi:hypothetical protein